MISSTDWSMASKWAFRAGSVLRTLSGNESLWATVEFHLSFDTDKKSLHHFGVFFILNGCHQVFNRHFNAGLGLALKENGQLSKAHEVAVVIHHGGGRGFAWVGCFGFLWHGGSPCLCVRLYRGLCPTSQAGYCSYISKVSSVQYQDLLSLLPLKPFYYLTYFWSYLLVLSSNWSYML